MNTQIERERENGEVKPNLIFGEILNKKSYTIYMFYSFYIIWTMNNLHFYVKHFPQETRKVCVKFIGFSDDRINKEGLDFHVNVTGPE